MPGIVEWDCIPWAPGAWRGIDQAPAFLGAFRAGDDVLSLSGEFVTTPGVHGAGPTAASDFVLALTDSLCELGDVSLEMDLYSRTGLRTDELLQSLRSLEQSGLALLSDDGQWAASLPRGSAVLEWVGLLVGSNLDYQLRFGDARFAERDAAIVLVAGPAGVVARARALVERVASETGTELKPIGWDA